MVTRNPQNVHRKYYWAILMTFISDVKIDVNMCEPHYVNLFFLWTSSIVCMFDFLTFDIFLTTWHLFDNLTSFWYFDTFNLNHLSPHRAIFAYFWRQYLSDFDVWVLILKLRTSSTRIWAEIATRGPIRYLKMAEMCPKIANIGNFRTRFGHFIVL